MLVWSAAEEVVGMRALLVSLVIVLVLALGWLAALAWHRLSNQRTAQALGQSVCETCGVTPLSDERSCRACGTPLYVSHLAGRRGG